MDSARGVAAIVVCCRNSLCNSSCDAIVCSRVHQNRASLFASDFYRRRGYRRESRSEDHFYPFSSQKRSRFASDFLRRGNRTSWGLKKSRDFSGSGKNRRCNRRESRDFGALRFAVVEQLLYYFCCFECNSSFAIVRVKGGSKHVSSVSCHNKYCNRTPCRFHPFSKHPKKSWQAPKSTRKRNTPENASNRPFPESAISGVFAFSGVLATLSFRGE